MVMDLWKNKRGITPWRPQRDMEEFEQRVKDFFGTPWPALFSRGSTEGWSPTLDIFEKDGKMILKAELPGVKEEDIDVSVVGNDLRIRGSREMEKEVKEEDYRQMERSYGSFFRSIPIPSDIDTDKIEASYENGLLQVTLPKNAEAAPKKVPVSSRKTKTKEADKEK